MHRRTLLTAASFGIAGHAHAQSGEWPARPVTITVHGGTLDLPLHAGSQRPAPTFSPGAASSSENPDGVSWTITRDVLRDVTTCAVDHGTDYDVPHGRACEHYAGAVVVDNQTFAQHASAECSLGLTWPGVDVRVASKMRVDVGADGYEVSISATAWEEGAQVSHREWAEHLPR